MLVGELLIRKEYIKKEIKELRLFVQNLKFNGTDNSDLHRLSLNRLFDLLDKYQDLLVVLEQKNISNTIKIGESEINISDAVKLRGTINSKMDVLSDSINSSDYSIDIFSLIQQRDELMEEFILINNEIIKNDWSGVQ